MPPANTPCQAHPNLSPQTKLGLMVSARTELTGPQSKPNITRLKNAGATYQRVATTLFHDMMHRDVEVYMDDMILKFQGKANHLAAPERFF